MLDKRGSIAPPHTLEFAPACKQLSLLMLVICVASFTVTWYKVWWDTLIGIGVMSYGYRVLRDTNPVNLDPVRVKRFYHGVILSLSSHIIAVGVVTYFVIKIYLLDKIINDENGPGIPLLVFLYLFLLFEIGVTSITLERAFNLCQEISRNEYFLQSTVRV